MGFEVQLPPAPDAAQSVILEAGNGETSDAELKRYAPPIVLRTDGSVAFGGVIPYMDQRAWRSTACAEPFNDSYHTVRNCPLSSSTVPG
jgi:hypothetical protein